MRKTKEERKQLSEKKKLKRSTFFTSLITLVSFLYKFGLGFLTKSLVLLIASISTLMVFICKVVFVKNVLQTREKNLIFQGQIIKILKYQGKRLGIHFKCNGE